MQTVLMPAVAVASSVPGRMRLKLPTCQWSGGEYALKETMHSITGVTDLRWTQLTNSLVVYYDHQRTSSAEILDQCQRVLSPLVVPNAAVPALAAHPALPAVQSNGHAAAGGGANANHGEKPASTPSADSPMTPGKWFLGVSLVIVGAVLFIIPFVPGLPLLLMGLTLLQLT